MDCVVTKESVSTRQADYRKAFSGLKDITFIDSLPVFCPNERCLVFGQEGGLLYADDDHLSVAGSRFQVKKLLAPHLD